MQPLIVTAELRNGFVSSDPWSPALDGILAYQAMREKLGDEEFAIRNHRSDLQEPITGVPLAEESDGTLSWYQCSSPVYQVALEHKRFFHRRFDAKPAEKYWEPPGKSGKVLVAAGPYKNARLPATHHITPRVQWACIGDPAEIRRLLAKTTAIGGRLGAGMGRVREWHVEPAGEEAETLARTHRPLPVGHTAAESLTGPVMPWGIRPPGRNPANITECAMPSHREALDAEA